MLQNDITLSVQVRIIGLEKCYLLFRTKKQASKKEVLFMKGYVTASGYMGYVNGSYILFACEEDYREYILAD